MDFPAHGGRLRPAIGRPVGEAVPELIPAGLRPGLTVNLAALPGPVWMFRGVRRGACRLDRSGPGLGERGEAAQRLLDDLMLAVEPVRLVLGQAGGHVDGCAAAGLGELPGELDV